MARNLLTLRTGELLSLCREIVAARAVLERYPLTAGYVTVLREAHAALEQATRPAASAEAVIARAELQRTLGAQGRDFARLSTELATLLDTLALVRPARAISCRAARRALFPSGLRVVTVQPRAVPARQRETTDGWQRGFSPGPVSGRGRDGYRTTERSPSRRDRRSCCPGADGRTDTNVSPRASRSLC